MNTPSQAALAVLLLAPLLALAAPARALCPCKEGDIDYDDVAAQACGPELRAIESLRRRPPSSMAVMESALASYRAQLRDCVAKLDRRARADVAMADRDRLRGEARTRRDAQDDLNRADVTLIRQVLSAGLCVAQEQHATAARAVAKERHLKSDGLSSPSTMSGFEKSVRDADSALARARTLLRTAKLTPLPCTQPEVRRLQACYRTRILDVDEQPDSKDICQAPRVQDYLRLGR